MAAASAGGSRSGTTSAVRPSSTTAPIPPAAVVTSGVPEASASRTTFGRPSTLPLSSRTDGTTTMSAAARYSPTSILGQVAEKADAFRDAGALAPAPRSSSPRVPSPAMASTAPPARCGQRVDEVLEPFLAHEPSGGEAAAARDRRRRARGAARPATPAFGRKRSTSTP